MSLRVVGYINHDNFLNTFNLIQDKKASLYLKKREFVLKIHKNITLEISEQNKVNTDSSSKPANDILVYEKLRKLDHAILTHPIMEYAADIRLNIMFYKLTENKTLLIFKTMQKEFVETLIKDTTIEDYSYHSSGDGSGISDWDGRGKNWEKVFEETKNFKNGYDLVLSSQDLFNSAFDILNESIGLKIINSKN